MGYAKHYISGGLQTKDVKMGKRELDFIGMWTV